MATPAELRMLELLDKWLGSLDLHLKYAALDDSSYAKIQKWPAHQRPNRWIIELARQRAVALRTQVEDRVRMGDSKFADALEMMIFLANLVGIQHIERYIPLAERERELPSASGARPAGTANTDEADSLPDNAATGTHEMPEFAALAATPPAALPDPPPPAAVVVPRPQAAVPTAPTAAAPTATAPTAAAPTAPAPPAAAAADAAEIFSLDLSLGFDRHPTPPAAATVSEAMRTQVLADAERLLQWGRRWFELPELITRMADRPPLAEVRRILRENRAALDKKIRRS